MPDIRGKLLSAADFLRANPGKAPPAPAEAPASLHTVELPSRGLLYEPGTIGASVQLSPFTVGQVRALKAVTKSADPATTEQIIVDAVGRSLHEADALDLTMGDFRFLMYWLRLNSYDPFQFTVRVTDAHGNGQEYVMTKSDLVVTAIDPGKLLDTARFGGVSMRDHIAIMRIDDPGKAWVASHAAYLRGGTLDERIERLGREPLATIADIRRHTADSNHGVEEYALITQEGHTEAVRVQIKLDVADFFP